MLTKAGCCITQTKSKRHFKTALFPPETGERKKKKKVSCRSLAYFMKKILVCLRKSALDSLTFKSKAAPLLQSWRDTCCSPRWESTHLSMCLISAPCLHAGLPSWVQRSLSLYFHCKSLKYFLCTQVWMIISWWSTTTYADVLLYYPEE